MSVSPLVFDLNTTGLRIPLVPVGNRIRGVQVLALPAAAVGLVSLRTGSGDATPLALVGQVIPVQSTSGLTLDNNNPGLFPVGSTLSLLLEVDP